MMFFTEDKYLRAAVRLALDEMMKLNVMRLSDDQDFPDQELFEEGDQDKDGWEVVLRIDVGTEDFLLEQNRGMHKLFTEAGIEHEYQEFPGAHTWEYWDKHVQEAIAFNLRNLS